MSKSGFATRKQEQNYDVVLLNVLELLASKVVELVG